MQDDTIYKSKADYAFNLVDSWAHFYLFSFAIAWNFSGGLLLCYIVVRSIAKFLQGG